MTGLSNRYRVAIAAFILVPVLLYWGFASSPNENGTPRSVLSDKMDYFVDKATVKEWDASGKPQRKLTTARLEHDPRQQHSTLTNPESFSYRDNNSAVKISALTGTVLDDNSRTDLAGDVIVNDNPNSDSATVLNTTRLSVFPKQDFAETDKPVTIISPQSRLEGVGMDINFNSRILNLHSRVKGAHENEK